MAIDSIQVPDHPAATAHGGTTTSFGRMMRDDWWKHLLLLIISFFLFFPFIMTLIISFKDMNQFSVEPFLPTFPLHWSNYQEAGEVVFGDIGIDCQISSSRLKSMRDPQFLRIACRASVLDTPHMFSRKIAKHVCATAHPSPR